MGAFIKENLYSMVKMLLNQFALTIFGTMLAIATAQNTKLLLGSSIFSILFYLVILYSMGWELGAKDKIKIDGGRLKPMPLKGFFISLGANLPNLLLALLMGLGVLINTEWSANISLVCNAIARFAEGMYIGVIKVLGDAVYTEAAISDIWWWFILITIPAMLTGWFAYYLGMKGKSIASIFGIKVKPDTRRN